MGPTKAAKMGPEMAEELALGVGAAIGEGALGKLPDALVCPVPLRQVDR